MQQLKNIIFKSIQTLNLNLCISEIDVLPISAQKIDGHYYTNILFKEKALIKHSTAICQELKKNSLIKNAEIVNNYINLELSLEYFITSLNILEKENLIPDIGKKEKINIEYCSVNPTGLLHIGHARNAIFGDALARLFQYVNYDVTKEYYVNDGGSQIDLLAESVYARYCELNNIPHTFPSNGYPGPEIYEVAKKINSTHSKNDIAKIAVDYFIQEIKKDLNSINIFQESWVYESDIIKSGNIESALEICKQKNCIYYGTIGDKHVKKGKISKNDLMILATTKFGDDQDRPLTKEDGSYTYFCPDIGYHYNKIQRGFKYLICVLGADHDSYAQRIKIAVKILNEDIIHKTSLCQMVSFSNEGNLVKFSKRAGNSIKISEFIEQIEPDILRFMILERSCDTQFIFNYEEAVNLSMKNPVFYCQYAYARACSLIRNFEHAQSDRIDSHFFYNKEVQDFIITMEQFSLTINEAVNELAPHKLINYLKKIAEKMHKLWQIGKIDKNLRIITEDINESKQRIKLIYTFKKIAKICFDILGVQAPEKLESKSLEVTEN